MRLRHGSFTIGLAEHFSTFVLAEALCRWSPPPLTGSFLIDLSWFGFAGFPLHRGRFHGLRRNCLYDDRSSGY